MYDRFVGLSSLSSDQIIRQLPHFGVIQIMGSADLCADLHTSASILFDNP
jgi:hypothetical protein